MSSLPTALARHFSAKATMSMSELAEILPMDRGTLKRHIEEGRLIGRHKGFGRVKPHRVFTEQDVVDFLRALEDVSIPIAASSVDRLSAQTRMRMNVTRRRRNRKAVPAAPSCQE